MTTEYETIGRIATRTKKSTRAVTRWVRHGIIGKDGSRVRLAGVYIGGTIRVPIGALDAFIAAINAEPAEDTGCPRVPKSKTEADRIHRAALARLEFERLARTR